MALRARLLVLLSLATCATLPVDPDEGAGAAAIEPSSRPAPLPAAYYRIDRLGRRIGWLRHEVVYERRAGEERLVERVEAETRMSRDGIALPFHATEERVYEPSPDGALLEATVRREHKDGDRHAEARCSKAGCDVVLRGDGPTITRRLPATEETAAQALAAQRALATGPHSFTYLDLDELREERRVASAGADEPLRDGVRRGVRIEIRTEGEPALALEWLAQDGRPLAARFSDGSELTAVTELEARATPEALELGSLAVIPLPNLLDRSRPISEIRLVVEGLPEAARFPSSYRRYEALADGAVRISIAARSPPELPLPIDPAPFARELAVTADLDHDHPDLRRVIDRLPIDRMESALQLAVACVGIVDHFVPRRAAADVDRASGILRGGKAGPDDAARLYVALARAAGLPARRVSGFLYAEQEGQPVLLFSAWAEVFVGEWIEVDPFLRELPASPGHLLIGRDGTGDGGFGLLGKLQVRSFEAALGGTL